MVKKKKTIKELKEEFLRNQKSEEEIDKVINKVYTFLSYHQLKYHRKAVRNRLIKIGTYYNIEEDIGKILVFLIDNNKFVPTNMDHFWGYSIKTFQYPPFEPEKHFQARKGKKKIKGQEWAFLMKIKRYPYVINNSPPKWLDYALTYNKDFATVYELYVAEAREKLGDLSETEKKDVSYGNLGMKKALMDIDLKKILKEIEGS